MGPLAYGEEDGEVFLGHSVTQHKSVSDDTANSIDLEIRRIIDTNYARAEKLLKENMDKLHTMAQALIKYETIDKDQIDEIMGGKVPSPPKDWMDDDKPDSGTPASSSQDDTSKDSGPIGGPASEH